MEGTVMGTNLQESGGEREKRLWENTLTQTAKIHHYVRDVINEEYKQHARPS